MSTSDLIEEVRRWLRFAGEDLRAADSSLDEEDFRPRHVCWLAQQAAEKALKGALASQQIPSPSGTTSTRCGTCCRRDGW